MSEDSYRYDVMGFSDRKRHSILLSCWGLCIPTIGLRAGIVLKAGRL